MRELLLISVLACACCGAPPAQGQTNAERMGGIVTGEQVMKCSEGADEKMHCEARSVMELADEIGKTEMIRLRSLVREGTLLDPTQRVIVLQEKPEPAPQPEEQADYIVMTALDYQRLMYTFQLLTHAVETQNTAIARLTRKLKEACP